MKENGRLPVAFMYLCEPILIEIVETSLQVCVLGGTVEIFLRAPCQNKLDVRKLRLLSNFSLQFGEFSNTCQPSNKQFTVTVRN